jgi:hypothetical protein
VAGWSAEPGPAPAGSTAPAAHDADGRSPGACWRRCRSAGPWLRWPRAFEEAPRGARRHRAERPTERSATLRT